MDSVAGHLLANHRGLMQQVKIKEVLTEYYRIWLIIQHPSQFDEYVKTLEIGIGTILTPETLCEHVNKLCFSLSSVRMARLLLLSTRLRRSRSCDHTGIRSYLRLLVYTTHITTEVSCSRVGK